MMESTMSSDQYDEGYWERGEGSNYVNYGNDPGWRPTAQILARFASVKHEPDLLEVGCAKGFFVFAAGLAGFEAEGIDISEYAISHPAPWVSHRLRQGNAVDLPWSDDTFDVVCSWEMLEHVPVYEVLTVLDEMVRVTRPGGLYVHRIGTYDPENPADHDHMDDKTHVTNQPRVWWEDVLAELSRLRRRPEIEAAFDVEFSDRDWAGRYFAYEVLPPAPPKRGMPQEG